MGVGTVIPNSPRAWHKDGLTPSSRNALASEVSVASLCTRTQGVAVDGVTYGPESPHAHTLLAALQRQSEIGCGPRISLTARNK